MRQAVARGRQQSHWHDRIAQGLLVLVCVALVAFLLMPVCVILIKSVQDKDGAYVGLQQFITYMSTPALHQSVLNTLFMAGTVTALVIPAAFLFAYALTRSMMPGKGLFRTLSLIPILAPSLLAAISFIQWFGNQGVLKGLLGGQTIYGPLGMVLSEFYGVFPHALMIIVTALTMADGRLYEVAASLGTSRMRRFFTITLPGAKYGLISAALVVFTYTVNDFGVPKVIGGNFNVLSIDVYKLVIGQQDFNKGAVVSLLLLMPALVAFIIDIIIRRKLQAQLSSRAVAFVPKKRRLFDGLMLLYCALISLFMIAVLGMAIYTSFIKLWPYDLSLSLRHYYFGLVEGGILESYFNSLKLAFLVVVCGVVTVFGSAYLTEKTRGMDAIRPVIRLLAVLPMGVPGLVLGLGYILFFNHPGNPLNFMYHGMAILVVSTVVHYYTSSHLTAVTALKSIDNEFEAVSASLKVPFYKTFFRVTVQVCMPAILDVGRYLFVNAMTTISAVVFLYSPDTTLASVAILNLEEAGEIGPAAAMATLIVLTSSVVCLLYALGTRVLLLKTQGWRSRT
ncbi:putative 2-aminoethylphosphonate ABC transporter permease subunit [Undibacterium sp.]|uniref:putative 2-aminoethylphosphonate ABC transporter permease subunit n=1 Tax=Undibacterium sp. TaxID=1914977 RepID=UPI002BEED59F|nr:putative 2-aminoethylphosphonate ABC transporter permease subunit [Undibacterium sp.]HTD03893.1 putative 2-aminoethylphosphonate ABC transporter permease subunit [Undibacterium sp.]